jgi:hypothetical protein
MSSYTVSPHEYVNNGQVVEIEQPTPFVKPKEIHVMVTPDRVDKIPMKYWRAVEKGTIDGMVNMAAWFLANVHGVFYTHDEALAIIDEMPRGEALAMVQTISARITEVSTPKK